jgi:hypothetical protein
MNLIRIQKRIEDRGWSPTMHLSVEPFVISVAEKK